MKIGIVLILALASILTVGCGPGQGSGLSSKKNVVNTNSDRSSGGMPSELSSFPCTRGYGETFLFRLSSNSRTGGRISGSLEPIDSFRGRGGQGFGGCHPNGHILYIEDQGNNEYDVLVKLCGFEGRNPRDWGSLSAVLSTKLNRFSNLYDITASEIRFARDGVDYYGNGQAIPERKEFSAVSCRR